MSPVLLHRLFGFIGGSTGLVVAITGAMFWFDPPDQALPAWGLLALMIGGVVTLLAGLGVAARLSVARYIMIGMAGLGMLAAAAGVGRALLAGNWGASVIVLTAVMPLVLLIAVMWELGRSAPSAD
ncbi:hypothetical protein [Salinisphaera sp. Q1T1-3]|uniref:hypothetical protein n=1 Tax=Salinisphaera sp. Q1T1-3 TaxID=2321229 RepID=UPI0011C4238E|nr:hypothetical protein [Salinisphaera sp. Q1T1-3]